MGPAEPIHMRRHGSVSTPHGLYRRTHRALPNHNRRIKVLTGARSLSCTDMDRRKPPRSAFGLREIVFLAVCLVSLSKANFFGGGNIWRTSERN